MVLNRGAFGITAPQARPGDFPRTWGGVVGVPNGAIIAPQVRHTCAGVGFRRRFSQGWRCPGVYKCACAIWLCTALTTCVQVSNFSDMLRVALSIKVGTINP